MSNACYETFRGGLASQLFGRSHRVASEVPSEGARLRTFGTPPSLTISTLAFHARSFGFIRGHAAVARAHARRRLARGRALLRWLVQWSGVVFACIARRAVVIQLRLDDVLSCVVVCMPCRRRSCSRVRARRRPARVASCTFHSRTSPRRPLCALFSWDRLVGRWAYLAPHGSTLQATVLYI